MGTTCEDGAEVGTGFSRQLTPLEAESGAWARVHENDMSLGHFVRTSERLFAPLARLARMASDDVLLDLGSGDGVMLATLAEQTGCCGIGVEVNPILCKKAERLRESLGFASWRLQYLCMQAEQLRLEDLNKVTIVYVYLLRVAENEVVMRLLQQVSRLRSLSRAPYRVAAPRRPDRLLDVHTARETLSATVADLAGRGHR